MLLELTLFALQNDNLRDDIFAGNVRIGELEFEAQEGNYA